MSSSALKVPTTTKGPPEERGLKLAYPGKYKVTNADYADVEEDESSEEADNKDTDPMFTTKKMLSSLAGPGPDIEKDDKSKTFTVGRTVELDDGISLMDVSVYVQRRLLTKLNSLRRELPKKERKYNVRN